VPGPLPDPLESSAVAAGDASPLARIAALPDRFARFALVGPWRARIAVALLCLPTVLYAVADLEPQAHIALSLLLLATALYVAQRQPHHKLVVIPLSVAASARYIWWRGTHTLATTNPADTAASLLLFAAELYAFSTLLGGYFQTAIERLRPPPPLDESRPLPTVDVYVPTFDEPLDILETTVEAALAMDYPTDRFRVFILDDTPKPPYKQRPKEPDAAFLARVRACEDRMLAIKMMATTRWPRCQYLARDDNRDAKAGNLNAAMARTDGELIAIFDTDHAPTQSFLKSTVGFFQRDEGMALVQTPHHFYSSDPFERNLYHEWLVPPEQHLFYHRIQRGNDFWNSAFFCGSCAVLRRSALDRVNGFTRSRELHTVTEDAHTALKLHAAGFRSAYLPIPQAAGLATERVADHIGQRIRWARGMAQIFAQDNPLLKRGLSVAQRLNYLNAAWHFFFGLPRLIFLLAPPAYLLFDLHPLLGDVREALIYALPHLLLAWIGAAMIQRNARHSFWPDVYETLLAPYTALVTSVALLVPRHGRFNVTTKGQLLMTRRFDWRRAAPAMVLLALAIASAVSAPYKFFSFDQHRDTVVIASLWNLLNLAVLGAAVSACIERPQRRREHRVTRQWPVRVSPAPERAALEPDPRSWSGRTEDLSFGGARVALDAGARLPEQVQLTLKTEFGVTLLADVQEQLQREGVVVARLKFRPLSRGDRRALTRNMFSSADSWVKDHFTDDRPLRSAMLVALSPLVVALGSEALVRRLLLPDVPLRPLIEGRTFAPCPECSAVPQTPAPRCTICGADLRERAALTVSRPPPRPLSTLLVPSLFLLLSLGLTARFPPVVRFFENFISMESWTAVPFQTRLAELHQAYRELSSLHRQLSDALEGEVPDAGGPEAFIERWEARLHAVQRDRALYGEASGRPESERIERELFNAVLSLKAAATEYRNHHLETGGDLALASDLLGSADRALRAAAADLGTPR
jgi:cellulose synthase (UDP-forming)